MMLWLPVCDIFSGLCLLFAIPMTEVSFSCRGVGVLRERPSSAMYKVLFFALEGEVVVKDEKMLLNGSIQ